MKPIKTEKFDGVYGAPEGYENEVGGLPYYREKSNKLENTIIFSVWEPSKEERFIIAAGANILVGQVGEPIHPMTIRVTHLKRVEDGTEG